MMTENVQYEYEYPTSDSTCCTSTTCTSHFACNDRTNESYQHRTMNMAAVTGSEATNVCQQQQQQDLHHRVSSETGRVDAETESEREQQPLILGDTSTEDLQAVPCHRKSKTSHASSPFFPQARRKTEGLSTRRGVIYLAESRRYVM